MEKPTQFAISIKQPWAALVVAGHKTIEIRRWPTARRGRVWIHAARVPDNRVEGWRRVPNSLADLSQLHGGIIGSVDLTDCVKYADLAAFLSDQAHHCNEAEWFEPKGLYGFKFTEPRMQPFQAYPGWFRFFKVEAVATAGG
jgi:hypothetical protein